MASARCPAAAQAARLVAFAFAKQAYLLIENVNGSVQYLSAPARTPSPEGDAKAPLDKVMDVAEQIGEKSVEELTAALVEVAQEVLESPAEQFEVEKEAIPAFLYETNAYILPVIEDMVAGCDRQARRSGRSDGGDPGDPAPPRA